MFVPNSYYEPEVREGFYIPGMMKRAWAAQIEVVEAVAKVCREAGIKYFADAGTLLGAIRHKGYIPWDDDLDICMRREDYDKFLRVAPDMLPEGFEVHSIYTDEEYDDYIIRVINGHAMNFSKEHLEKFHGFAHIAGIDIFPLDFIARDKEKEAARENKLEMILNVRQQFISHPTDIKENLAVLDKLSQMYGFKFDLNHSVPQQLCILADKTISAFDESEADELALFSEYRRSKKNGNFFNKQWYSDSISVPFEQTMVEAPIGYDSVLKRKYGDYMRLVKMWGTHNYPFYKFNERELEEIHGVKFGSYHYLPETQIKNERIFGTTYKNIIKGLIGKLANYQLQFVSELQNNEADNVVNLLVEMQNTAVELGNTFEEYEKQASLECVGILEEYCEQIFLIYINLAAGQAFDMEQEILKLCVILDCCDASAKKNVLSREEVLFLVYRDSNWKYLKYFYEKELGTPNTHVRIMEIYCFEKELDGSAGKQAYTVDKSIFDSDAEIIEPEGYNLYLHHPARIYTCNVYDETDLATTIDVNFYSSRIRSMTDNLIYIPEMTLGECMPEDMRMKAHMENYVTSPGVACADTVILDLESLRTAYIEKLTEWAGEDTRTIWEEKIIVDKECQKELRNHMSGGAEKKVIAFSVSISDVLCDTEKLINKLDNIIGTFKESKDRVAVLWIQNKLFNELCQKLDTDMRMRIQEKIAELVDSSIGEFVEVNDETELIEKCDAYYGCGGYLAHDFRNNSKPVMIYNLEC